MYQRLFQLNAIYQKFINIKKLNLNIKDEHLTILTNVFNIL